MKTMTKGPYLRAGLRRLWTKKPALWLRQGGLAFGAALLLSAIRLGSRPIQLAPCLLLGLDFFPGGLCAALGAVCGSLLLFPWTQALEGIVLVVLLLAAVGLFHDAGLRQSPRFAAALSAGLSGALGLVFLLDQGLSAQAAACFLVRLGLAAAAPVVCRQALQGKLRARYPAGLCLFVGAASLYPAVSIYPAAALGYALAIASAGGDILLTLLCGLGLDLTGALPCTMSAPLAGAALLCRLLPKKRPRDLALCFAAVGVLWPLLCGVSAPPLLAAVVLGSAAGTLLPLPALGGRPAAQTPPEAAQAQPMQKLAQAFSMMYRALCEPAPAPDAPGIAQVYDAAAETVCRLCVRCRICWQTQAEQTYRDLCAAAEPIWQRGLALREDFPAGFAGACCHMEGLLTAINQELDRSRVQRQLHNRRSESRRVLASQYLFLSRFLAHPEGPEAAAQPAFRPEFAVSGRSRTGVSGDRGASFQDRWGRFNVLLCDGMGAGEAAARQAGSAVRTLAALLEAGVAPDSALSLLNGCYILQEGSAFSTVDLLQLDLGSGEGVLYKWGAAPSYLKTGEKVQTLGAAAPPPGIGPDCRPAQLPLSLGGGQTLIMLSDGAFGERALQRCAQFRGGGARELASYLVSGLPETPEDDLTAAVVRLLPRAS